MAKTHGEELTNCAYHGFPEHRRRFESTRDRDVNAPIAFHVFSRGIHHVEIDCDGSNIQISRRSRFCREENYRFISSLSFINLAQLRPQSIAGRYNKTLGTGTHLWDIFSANARATYSIKSIEHRHRLLLSDCRVLFDIPTRSQQTSKAPVSRIRISSSLSNKSICIERCVISRILFVNRYDVFSRNA